MNLKLTLLFISTFFLAISLYGQNEQEILKRNKVKHITITKWTLDKDGKESPDGFPRVEEEYDTSGNLIEKISFVSYREKKKNKDTFKYDERNHLVEHTTYTYAYLQNDSVIEQFLEKYTWKYDEKNNLIYQSYKLTEKPDASDVEYIYSYKYNDKGLPIEKEEKTKKRLRDSDYHTTYIYQYDKFNNLISEKVGSQKTNYEIKYFKNSNKIQEREGTSSTREFYDEQGKVIKRIEGTMTKYFKYDTLGKIIERHEVEPTDVFTHHFFFSYNSNNLLSEKTSKNHLGEIEKEQNEKWYYDDKKLLSEYVGKGGKKKFKYIFY